MQHMFIDVNISCGADEIIGLIYAKQKRPQKAFLLQSTC